MKAGLKQTLWVPTFIAKSPKFNLENGSGGKQDSRSVSGLSRGEREGHCVIFLSKTLHLASLLPSVFKPIP